MIEFLYKLHEVVLYGCGVLIAATAVITFIMFKKIRRIATQMSHFSEVVTRGRGTPQGRDGISLVTLDGLRAQCEGLSGVPRDWWMLIDSHTEQYTSPEDVEGWFLVTVQVGREFLSRDGGGCAKRCERMALLR